MAKNQAFSDKATIKKVVPLDAMQNVPRVLPWQSWNEWAQVRDALFSNDFSLQAAAIQRISTWRLRGRLPHGIDSTSQLIETKINDQTQQSTLISDQSIRICYAMCIVRAVNGIVDGGQRGSHAVSIQKLAKKVGLPVWVVELRHDSTHNNLPHLPLLRLASDAILNWFVKEYWEKQNKFLSDIHLLCQGIIRRYDKGGGAGGKDQGHRVGSIDDIGLKKALTDLPNSTLSNMFIPLLFHNSNKEENHYFSNNTLYDSGCGGGGQMKEEESLNFMQSRMMDSYSIMIPKLDQTEENVEKLYFKLLPLLEALQSQWSGFSESLLTQLTEELKSLYQTLEIDKENDDNNDDDENNNNVMKNDKITELKHREYFLLAWVKLLLSRDWICRLLATPPPLTTPSKSSCGENDIMENNDEEIETFIKFNDDDILDKYNTNNKDILTSKSKFEEQIANEISSYKEVLEKAEDISGNIQSHKKRKKLNDVSEKDNILRLISHNKWNQLQRKFMLSICPVTYFENANVLTVMSLPSDNNSSLTYVGGDTCIPARLLRLSLWISSYEFSSNQNLPFSLNKQKLYELLKSPFSFSPAQHNREESDMISAAAAVSTAHTTASDTTDEEFEGLAWDWVPCPIGALPGRSYAPLDVV